MPETVDRTGAPPLAQEISRVTAAIALVRPTPMRHAIWYQACAEAIGPDDAFETIIAGDPQTPRAAAFFRKKAQFIFQRLLLLGGEDIPLHTDVLYESDEAARALAEEIVNRKLPARFGYVTAHSRFVDALKHVARGKAFIVSSAIDGAPFLRLDETFLHPEQRFNKRKQADLRRRRRKLESQGEVDISIACPRPNEVDGLLDEFMELEASGWKGRAESALVYDPDSQAFFRRYGRLASEAGIFRFSALRVDGKLIAARIGAQCDGSFWGFKSGYDESYKNCSPGVLLFLDVLRHAYEQEQASYEFLGALEPWIKDWTSDTHPKIRLRYYPYNFAGAAALSMDGSAALLHRVRKSMSARRKPR